jgi:hypothetical protein
MSFFWLIALLLISVLIVALRDVAKKKLPGTVFEVLCWLAVPFCALGASAMAGLAFDGGLFTAVVMAPAFVGVAAFMAPRGRWAIALLAFVWIQFGMVNMFQKAWAADNTLRWAALIAGDTVAAVIVVLWFVEWREARARLKNP